MKAAIQLSVVASALLLLSFTGCASVDTSASSTRPNEVSQDYMMTPGNVIGVKPFIYGDRTVLEFLDSPGRVTIKDWQGANIEYEREGHFLRLSRKVERFSLRFNGTLLSFTPTSRSYKLTPEPKQDEIGKPEPIDFQQEIDRLKGQLAEAKKVDFSVCEALQKPVVVDAFVESPPPAIAHEEQKAIVLASDTLFKFGGGHINDMLPAGRATLKQLAKQINSNAIGVLSMRIIGNTDRIGKEIRNQTLSELRAASVRDYLVLAGVSLNMQVVGVGSNNPVVACQGLLDKEAIECLQPNRRVEIFITSAHGYKEHAKT